jgi:predicted nucleotidyltransferase
MNHGTHAEVSRRGGKARSAAKTAANRAKASAFWRDVRAGRRPAPRRRRERATPQALARLLSGYCLEKGIMRLDVFGATARGEVTDGSIHLIATCSVDPGRRLDAMQADMAALVGGPVHLLSRESLDRVANPFRRLSILADTTLIYAG